MLLLVEDDEGDVWATRRAFSGLSAVEQVETFKDGEHALHWLQERSGDSSGDDPLPALVLLDLNLPRINGIEFLERMKTDHLLRHIPVIILTTSANSDDIQRAYAAGASSYLVKPASMDGFTKVAEAVSDYYFHTAQLPN
jgi:CheY-like chemotaxis protein